ncbi:hypothetical protein BSY19_4413 [Bosea sp. RAC05]|nr:hypothetical protein BSY19_4413 [Bosea sp. RAC05]
MTLAARTTANLPAGLATLIAGRRRLALLAGGR